MTELRTAIDVMVAFMCTCSLKRDHFPFLIFIIDINDILTIKTKKITRVFQLLGMLINISCEQYNITWKHQ